MKGITPVIAIILLLLITISMVGFAFVWFQRVAQTSTTAANSQLATQLNQESQIIAIDNVNTAASNITMRHTGTVATDVSQVQLYINNVLKTCAWDIGGAWSPGGTKSCTIVGGLTCTGTTLVAITAPGNKDSTIC